jgi:hypothetical protein
MADKLFRDYFNEKVTDTVLPANAKVLIQDGTGEPTQINAGSISTGQLVKVTENGETGYRLKDADPANYGNIGFKSVDLSTQTQASTTRGATGELAFVQGINTTASGEASNALGDTTIASGYSASANGGDTIASGDCSTSQGVGSFARARGEHSGGIYGTDYTPTQIQEDRLVNYGNGVDTNNRSDAYTLFKNGMQKFFTAALSTITNAVKGSVMLDENARLNIHDGTAFKAVAFTSEVATAAQGVTADNSVQLTGAQTVAGVKTFTNNIIANGNVGINQTTPTQRLDVVGNGKFSGTVTASNGTLLAGTGTTNFLPKFTASGVVGNSSIFDNGTNVGIGTTTLDETLNIFKTDRPYVKFSSTSATLGVFLGFANSDGTFQIRNKENKNIEFLTNDIARSVILANGNFGINKTIPIEKLDVVGNGKFSGTVTAGSDINANGLTVGRGGGNISTNTANGVNALFSNTTGVSNTANGVNALLNNTTGGNNTANGVNALLNNTTGGNNTANGSNALRSNTTGSDNTANGRDALFNNTTGGNNTANGVSSGRFIVDGSTATIVNNSVFLGFNTKPLGNSQTNQIVIGHTAIGAGSNTVTLGNTAITNTILRGAVSFAQFTTATEPAYLKGAQFFNTTLDKMRIGGATAYETVTSS